MLKYGMNMLLHTFHVTSEHYAILERIKNVGYDGVELPILDLNVQHFKDLGKHLDQLGLDRTAVSISTAQANPISPDPAIRAAAVTRLKCVIDCCEAAGVRLLCGPIHSALGEFSGAGPTTQELKWCAEVLKEVADYAQTKGAVLVLEALNRFECYLFTAVRDLAEFCRTIRHPNIKMMYDTFHANIEEKDIGGAMQFAWNQVVHVHISENDRSTPGEGHIDWKTTFGKIKSLDYDGWLTVEAFGFSIQEIAAATKVWRKMFINEEQLERDALEFMKRMMAK